MAALHCPSASIPECKDYPLDIVTKDIRFKHSPWFYKVAPHLGSSAPPTHSTHRLVGLNDQMLRLLILNMALSEKDTSFQSSSDLAPSLRPFFTRKRVCLSKSVESSCTWKATKWFGRFRQTSGKKSMTKQPTKKHVFSIYFGASGCIYLILCTYWFCMHIIYVCRTVASYILLSTKTIISILFMSWKFSEKNLHLAFLAPRLWLSSFGVSTNSPTWWVPATLKDPPKATLKPQECRHAALWSGTILITNYVSTCPGKFQAVFLGPCFLGRKRGGFFSVAFLFLDCGMTKKVTSEHLQFSSLKKISWLSNDEK